MGNTANNGNISNALSELPEKTFVALTQLANKVYETKDPKVQLPGDISDKVLAPAISAGIIELKDGFAVFLAKEALVFLLDDYLCDIVQEAWNDLQALADTMRDIHRAELRLKDTKGLGTKILARIHNEKGYDTLDLISRVIEQEDKHLFWAMSHAFTDALPDLQVSVEEVLHILPRIQHTVKNDLGGGRFYRSIGNWCKNNPSMAMQLYDELRNNSGDNLLSFTPEVLRGVAHSTFERAHAAAVSLASSKDPNEVRAGVLSLAELPYEKPLHDHFLAATKQRLAELIDHHNHDVLAALVVSYRLLWSYLSSESALRIEQLSEVTTPVVQYRVAEALLIKDDHFEEDWFRRSLMNLSTVEASHSGITSEIDSCFLSFLPTHPSFILDFFERWIVSGVEDQRREVLLSDTFQGAIGGLFQQHKELLEKRLTLWLNSDDKSLQQAAVNILRNVHLRPAEWRLSKDVLDDLSVADLRFITYRILGYLVDGDYLCSLLMSILDREPEDEGFIDDLTKLLVTYVGYNYPGATEKYMTQIMQAGNDVKKRVAKQVLEAMNSYYEHRKELPRLTEFVPPTPRVQAFLAARQKQTQAIMKETQGRYPTPVLDLFKKVEIRGGRMFYMDMNDGSTQRIPFQSYSTQFEVPRGQIIDPIGQQFRRIQWLMTPRGSEA